jgi:hypothetical protein
MTRRWPYAIAVLAILGATLAPSLSAEQNPGSSQAPSSDAQQDWTTFRANYDVMMSNFERMAAATGNTARQERAHQGREAMRLVTDAQLAKTFGQNPVPDLSFGATASQYLAAKIDSQKTAETKRALSPLTPGFPGPVALVAGCDGVDITADTRYALFIIKEVANSILAAAAWVCNEDILGENGSAACIPLAIAADVANGFFDTATFCAGEVTANQVDANFNRLDHIHNDLADAQASIDALDTHLTNVNNQITAEFTALNTHLTNVDNHIATEFTALDTHVTNVDNHIAAEFTALDAHMVALFATLGAQLTGATNLLSADLKQVMKLELTPEGLRQIVPAILTCTVAANNCPNVLNACNGTGGRCSWNNVGPLP